MCCVHWTIVVAQRHLELRSMHKMLTDSNDSSGHSESHRCSSFAYVPHGGRSWLVVAFVVCAAALGCGGDENKKASGNTATAGTSGESGSSGASGDSAGSSGASGSGPVGPQRVSCGDNTCYPPTNPLTGLLGSLGNLGNLGNLIPMAYACCLDEGAGTCGISASEGGACEAKATTDPRCPGVSLGALGGAAGGGMAGCCIDNHCGQDGTMFGRGCVENTQAAAMLQAIPLIGTLAQLPGALACDRPMDHQSDRDAGVETEDAGR
jgi:hypothetical protein